MVTSVLKLTRKNMETISCQCDNGYNCIHLRHLRPKTPPPTPENTDRTLTSPAYSPEHPVYTPTSPAYSRGNMQVDTQKQTKDGAVNRKRKIVDVIDLTKDEVVVKQCKVMEKANNFADMDKFECPITQCFMTDPVVDILGHTYERSALQEWLRKKLISPMTRQDYRGILLKRKMATKRDSMKLLREKIVVGKNYSMIHDPSWILLNKKKQ